MSAITRTPQNPNFLQPNKFQLEFARTPNLQYFCQAISVPGISLSEAIIMTPFIDLYAPGEKAIYDILNVTFLVDENLSSWLEIHDWIKAMTFPEDFEQYRELPKLQRIAGLQATKTPQYSDATLTLLSSSNTPTWRFKFFDCFPTSISAIVMSAADGPDTQVTADATFRFSYYDVEKLF